MPKWHQIAFTTLELKGLWVRATGGQTENDPLLDLAAETAIDKLYRAEKGMPRFQPEKPEAARRRGVELNVERRHRPFNCECPKCHAKGAA